LDYRSRRELDRLLGDLDADRQQDRQRDRQSRIREAGHAFQFETAKVQVLRPAMRDVMARLEHRGHAARLVEPKPTNLRVEVMLQGAAPVRGLIEVELDDSSGNVWFRARRQGQAVGECALAVGELNENAVAATLVHLLRQLTEAPAPPPAPKPW